MVSPSRQQLYQSLAQHTVLCLRRLVGKTHLISDSGRGFKLENPRELESEHFGRAEEDEKNGNEEGKQFGGKKRWFCKSNSTHLPLAMARVELGQALFT
ncbi:aldehyde dehydrogenase 6B2 [Prunus dulcis]|uniref:Aldehyde dehydrogenase 6B2 n=1 Tax=Prunus dulcis TaxID=3755 RepID=A0A5H2XMS6_PRUDU|nr:aldehyde dehydrogenase 6B2 [Prunus dulcis]